MPITINPHAPFDLGFNAAELTHGVNLIPSRYGRLNMRNAFPHRGVSTRSVIIDRNHGVLNVLPTVALGGPATKGKKEQRDQISLIIPHIPHEDVVKPADVQDKRKFGESASLETVAEAVLEKEIRMRQKFEQTWEYMKLTALRGKILDGNGATVLDLNSKFGEKQGFTKMNLASDTTDVKGILNGIRREVEINLRGETMTQMRWLCSAGFWDGFTDHAKVKEAFARWEDGRFLREDMRHGFVFNDMIFEEYNGVISYADGSGTDKLIPDNEAVLYIEGTMEMYETVFAPGDNLDAANQVGQDIYVSPYLLPHGKGLELNMESNPLPLVTRPKCIQRIKNST